MTPSKPVASDRFFFLVQSLLKFVAFDWAVGLRSTLYRPFFRSFGKGVKIFDNVTIKYPSQIELGNFLRINEGCYLVGVSGVTIGDSCMLGAGTKIVTTAHNFERRDLPMAQQGLKASPITIHNDVWFGFDAIVLGGSIIGKGAVIGAGAVVAGGEIPEYAIVGGIPARVIGNRP